MLFLKSPGGKNNLKGEREKERKEIKKKNKEGREKIKKTDWFPGNKFANIKF